MGLCVGQLLCSEFGFDKACTAINDDGVLDALVGLAEIGFEHLELKADAPCLAPEKEFRVCKRHAVGVGQQQVAFVGVGVQLFPGVGQVAFIELGVGFHVGSSGRDQVCAGDSG